MLMTLRVIMAMAMAGAIRMHMAVLVFRTFHTRLARAASTNSTHRFFLLVLLIDLDFLDSHFRATGGL